MRGSLAGSDRRERLGLVVGNRPNLTAEAPRRKPGANGERSSRPRCRKPRGFVACGSPRRTGHSAIGWAFGIGADFYGEIGRWGAWEVTRGSFALPGGATSPPRSGRKCPAITAPVPATGVISRGLVPSQPPCESASRPPSRRQWRTISGCAAKIRRSWRLPRRSAGSAANQPQASREGLALACSSD